MQDKTAKLFRQVKRLRGRDLSGKVRARILARVRQGHAVIGVEPPRHGGRKTVTLIFSEGPGQHLPVGRTGGTVYRDGIPIDATVRRVTRVDAAPEPVKISRAPTTVARPRERRDRTSSPSRAGPKSEDDPEPPGTRTCACGCGRDISHRAETPGS